jgi:hypothetical protein
MKSVGFQSPWEEKRAQRLSKLRPQLGTATEQEAAFEYVRSLEEDMAPWLQEKPTYVVGDLESIGAIILSGRGPEIAALLDQRMRSDAFKDSDALLSDTPVNSRTNRDWVNVSIIKLLRGDLSPLPPGVLSPKELNDLELMTDYTWRSILDWVCAMPPTAYAVASLLATQDDPPGVQSVFAHALLKQYHASMNMSAQS